MGRLFYAKRRIGVERAFALLVDPGNVEISPEQWTAFFKAYCGEPPPEGGPAALSSVQSSASSIMQTREQDWNIERSSRLFRGLDYDSSSGLSLDQFTLFADALLDGRLYIPRGR